MTDFNDYTMGRIFFVLFYNGRLVAKFQLVQTKAKKTNKIFTGTITKIWIYLTFYVTMASQDFFFS